MISVTKTQIRYMYVMLKRATRKRGNPCVMCPFSRGLRSWYPSLNNGKKGTVSNTNSWACPDSKVPFAASCVWAGGGRPGRLGRAHAQFYLKVPRCDLFQNIWHSMELNGAGTLRCWDTGVCGGSCEQPEGERKLSISPFDSYHVDDGGKKSLPIRPPSYPFFFRSLCSGPLRPLWVENVKHNKNKIRQESILYFLSAFLLEQKATVVAQFIFQSID